MTTFTESILAPLGHGVVRAPAEATVLVIDDDPAMRDILTTVAQQHGFGLQFAEDGAEGLRLAEQSDVDLILLDLSLPGMPGLDVCRRLRGAGVEVPIIILSASTDTVDVVVALEIGADDYIAKPFEIRELAARVNATAGSIMLPPSVPHCCSVARVTRCSRGPCGGTLEGVRLRNVALFHGILRRSRLNRSTDLPRTGRLRSAWRRAPFSSRCEACATVGRFNAHDGYR